MIIGLIYAIVVTNFDDHFLKRSLYGMSTYASNETKPAHTTRYYDNV